MTADLVELHSYTSVTACTGHERLLLPDRICQHLCRHSATIPADRVRIFNIYWTSDKFFNMLRFHAFTNWRSSASVLDETDANDFILFL